MFFLNIGFQRFKDHECGESEITLGTYIGIEVPMNAMYFDVL